ncbi:ClpX C4-type zinc finger protein [Thermaerobacter composti]|uniref:ClpX C4-type zinc finger protein n=1 Tax=Thermaerobacter composti TaxID=554949 RepID=A0ABZ0QRU7_9FIRM|nr:ClpX C4-type zinc finger protein [Thermaerobacter composti]WPD19763.1 ClpX C4-type zinc finger protein [Thermaerobacter composti]
MIDRLKSCSFCGKTEAKVKLISAPDDYDLEMNICSECVEECIHIIDGKITAGKLFRSATVDTTEERSTNCSLCFKSPKQAGMLLTNGTLFICNECISLCKMVLDEESKNRAGK